VGCSVAHLRPEGTLCHLRLVCIPAVRRNLLLHCMHARGAPEATPCRATAASVQLLRARGDERLERRALKLSRCALPRSALRDAPVALQLGEALDIEVFAIVPEVGADVIRTALMRALQVGDDAISASW
jgi:hypothetical protein